MLFTKDARFCGDLGALKHQIQTDLMQQQDPVSNHLCFIHVVCTQQDGPACTVLCDDLPDESACRRVHTCCGLIQDHYLGTTQECQTNRQAAALATGELGCFVMHAVT